jgi:hypothetical protein
LQSCLLRAHLVQLAHVQLRDCTCPVAESAEQQKVKNTAPALPPFFMFICTRDGAVFLLLQESMLHSGYAKEPEPPVAKPIACMAGLSEGLRLRLLKEPYQTPLPITASPEESAIEPEPFCTSEKEPRFEASRNSA